MTRKYTNPPIVEVLCQFTFDANAMDWTVPGVLYGEFQDLYPNKSGQIQSMAVGAKQGEGAVAGSEIPKLRLRFASPDDAWLIQVEPNVLAVNFVRRDGASYPGWDDFRGRVTHAVTVFGDVVHAGVTSAALRYINRIELERPEPRGAKLSIADYLRPGLNLDDDLRNGRDVAFEHTYTLRCHTPPGEIVLQTSSADLGEARTATHIGLMLDVEFATHFEEPPALTDISIWLDGAHGEISTMFEACVTDGARELFGSVGGSAG